ncbi:MAG: NAD(+)/NADH kinase [Alistipes sp.]|nr:NAD(+)/NADH kinase [Alistipes sp.]
MNIILFSRKELKHRPEQLRTIIESITRHGLEYSINEDFANVIESLTGISIDSKNRYKNFPKATGNDLLITYGGDGTLLDAVELRPSAETPIVGINCGRLGYLTADNGEGIEELFEHITRGTLHLEHRQLLSVKAEIECNDKCLALNEVTIHRHGATMISVEALVNDKHIATYHGDGIIISTPTGSTAYSLSAGGPIVDPMCSCLILSPLAPHNLTMRPIVIPDSSKITLRLDARGGEVFLSSDNRTYTLKDKATIELRKADKGLILATPHNNTFYDTLREKMMWGVDNR